MLFILFCTFYEAGAQADFESNLPIIRITTSEGIPDEPKVDGILEIIWNRDGTPGASSDMGNEYTGPIGIERRGQSSLFFFPKNGFSIETRNADGNDVDTSFLDFPSEEDWVLHGPYSDKSLMRNDLAMHLGNSMGQYHSRTQHVELILNGDYHGIYLLMEKIKRDKNRVDIANLKPEDIGGDELTGGYVIKIDKGDADWFSKYQLWQSESFAQFQFVSPNRTVINTPQRDYIKSYVDSFEMALFSSDFTYGGKRYDEYIDITSFADHFILKELSKDADAYRISSYYYKDKDSKGGKLTAGPAWDFNIAFGNINYCEGFDTSGWMYSRNCDGGIPFWWFRLMEDDVFKSELKCRWNAFSNDVLSKDNISSYVDDKVEEIKPAVDRNFERWPILGDYVWPNALITGSYQAEVNYLKEFVDSRWDWMDRNMPGTCEVSDTKELVTNKEISVFPNPSSELVNIEIDQSLRNSRLTIVDELGRTIFSRNYDLTPTVEVISIPVTGWHSGVYIVLVTDSKKVYSSKFVVE